MVVESEVSDEFVMRCCVMARDTPSDPGGSTARAVTGAGVGPGHGSGLLGAPRQGEELGRLTAAGRTWLLCVRERRRIREERSD